MGNPIVYFDTSLVIDYLLAQGREPEASLVPSPFPESDHDRSKREYWETLFCHDKRYQFATRLRSIIGWSFPSARIVVSPFVLLELDEWYAEECFKRYALEGTHVKAVLNQSRNDAAGTDREDELLVESDQADGIRSDPKEASRVRRFGSSVQVYRANLWRGVSGGISKLSS